jgi:hypothetical protein
VAFFERKGKGEVMIWSWAHHSQKKKNYELLLPAVAVLHKTRKKAYADGLLLLLLLLL